MMGFPGFGWFKKGVGGAGTIWASCLVIFAIIGAYFIGTIAAPYMFPGANNDTEKSIALAFAVIIFTAIAVGLAKMNGRVVANYKTKLAGLGWK